MGGSIMQKNKDIKTIRALLHLDRFRIHYPSAQQIFSWRNVANHIDSDVFDNERFSKMVKTLNPGGGQVCFFIGGKHNSIFYVQHKSLNQGFIIGYSLPASGDGPQKEDMKLFIDFLKKKIFQYE